MTQDLVLSQYKMGLRRNLLKEVRAILLREDHLTFEKAEELAKLHETDIKMLQRRSSGPAVMSINCYKCGESGHIAKDCKKITEKG